LLGIKSICLVDLFALEEYKWIANCNFASKVLVLNQSVKDFLVSKGRNEKDIEVTGNPAFDSIFHEDVLSKARDLRTTKYTQAKINVLFASNPEPKNHPFNSKTGDVQLPITNEKMMRDFIKSSDKFRLIIRYHPSQNVVFINSKDVILSPRDEDLHSMLHCMDIVVTGVSTVGLEGYLAGKKIITIDTSIFSEDMKYSELGISYGVNSKNQLFSAIQELGNDFKKETKQQGKPDLATPKVYNVIEKLLLDA
jgi:CDP-glycerol glycerophosphotransferase (TagB/SpsB family)